MNDTTIARIYRYAYEGELTGVALFGALAASASWAEGHEETLELAAQVEEQTREMLAPWLTRRGVTTCTVEHAERAVAEHHLPTSLAGTWKDFCQSLADWSREGRDKFAVLAALVPEDERAVAERLVEHEVALIEFAEASARGDEDLARAHLTGHLVG